MEIRPLRPPSHCFSQKGRFERYRAANRDADAHAVLAPALEGFPATQQLPELTEAQALLSALSP